MGFFSSAAPTPPLPPPVPPAANPPIYASNQVQDKDAKARAKAAIQGFGSLTGGDTLGGTKPNTGQRDLIGV